MTGYLSSAMLNAQPYQLTIELSVCACASYPQELGARRDLKRLIKEAQGHWALIVGFWGDLPNVVRLTIVDRRDGTIMWRNGRHLTQEDEIATTHTYQPASQQAQRGGRGNPRLGPIGDAGGRDRRR